MISKEKKQSDGINLKKIRPHSSTRIIRLKALGRGEDREEEKDSLAPPLVTKIFIPETKTHFAEPEPFLSKNRFESAIEKEVLEVQPGEKAAFIRDRLLAIKNAGYKKNRWRLWAGVVIVLAVIILTSTVFSAVTVTFKPKVESMALQDMVTTLDTSVSSLMPGQRIVPAELLEFSKKISQTFPVTTNKYVEEKASGKIKIYNGYSSSPQKLVASTRFATKSGSVYRLTESILIPGATIEEGRISPKSVEAVLVADKAGESFNFDKETTLKIVGFGGTPKYEAFGAVAEKGFSGGFKGATRVVSKDDLKKAQEQLTKRVYEELRAEIGRKIPPGFRILGSLQGIQITKIDAPPENTRTDNFAVETTARGRVLIFKDTDMISLINNIILKDNPSKKFLDNSAVLSYQVQSVDFDKGRAAVVVNGSIKTQAIVQDSDLAQMIRGQKEGSVNEFLKTRSELASFQASFFPPWISRAPNDISKIKFKAE